MHVLSLFIRTCLVWFIIFLVPPFETSATQETKLKSQRYYADGIQLSQAKYWKEAADEFRKAVQVDPGHKLAHANLGVTLSRLGNHKEALLAFDEAITLGYDHPLLRYNRGLSFAKLNLIEEAVQELELSLKMNPRNVKADYNLGLLYIKQNKLDDAKKQVNLLYTRNNDLAKKLFDSIRPKYKVMSVDNGGSIKGRVSLTGKVPSPRFFPLIASPNLEYCNRISDGKGHRILFDFTVSESRGLKDTVVKLIGVPKGKPFLSKIQKMVMNRCHTPKYVIGARNGETLLLENTDPIRHEIVAYEFTDGGVNQRSHRPVDANTSQTRDIFVKSKTENFLIKCNLHPFLQSRGIIVENPYYAITDEEGNFSIKDVPPGTYEVVAWHPFISNQIRAITIEPENQSTLNFEFNGTNVQRTIYADNMQGYRFAPVYDSKENFYGGSRIDDPIEILQEYKE
ncbi:MAG TPA: tetratricopeptide repeat protein [Nitrospinaceae bacterium]|nr:tetratricopeptide repeat protein [Nitrospinaceae bacterium]HIN87259.1 tetratricopeptide repeat protein [Nitrospinaceae bacterium]